MKGRQAIPRLASGTLLNQCRLHKTKKHAAGICGLSKQLVNLTLPWSGPGNSLNQCRLHTSKTKKPYIFCPQKNPGEHNYKEYEICSFRQGSCKNYFLLLFQVLSVRKRGELSAYSRTSSLLFFYSRRKFYAYIRTRSHLLKWFYACTTSLSFLEKNRIWKQAFWNFETRTVLLLSYTIYIKKERKVVKPHKTKTHTHTHPPVFPYFKKPVLTVLWKTETRAEGGISFSKTLKRVSFENLKFRKFYSTAYPRRHMTESRLESRISFCRISIQSTIVRVRKSVWK